MLIALLALATLAAPAPAATRDVSVSSFVFAPATVEIAPGDTVKWTFAGPGTNHSTTSDGGQAESWDSDPMNPSPNHTIGDTFSKTFNATGSFLYGCKVHASMRGTVKVVAPGQAPPPGSEQPPTGQPPPGGQPPSGAPPGSQPTADTTAPAFRGKPAVSVKRRRVTFDLDEAATVEGALRGPKRSRRTLKLDGQAGTNALKLPKRLLSGRYSLKITATDKAGNASTPVSVKFAVP